MDVFQPDRRATGRARERMERRQRAPRAPHVRAGTGAAPDAPPTPPAEAVYHSDAFVPRTARRMRERQEVESVVTASYGTGGDKKRGDTVLSKIEIRLHDFVWRARRDLRIPLGIAAAFLLLVFLYVGSFVFTGRIFPNVWALGVNVGGMTVDDATAALEQVWDQQLQVRLIDRGEADSAAREWAMTPAALGLRLNARATAEAARAVGVSGVPFGYKLLPTLDIDVLRAQNALLDMTDLTKIVPYNAGYRWQADTLLGVEGTDGRFLDVAATMTRLQADVTGVVDSRTLDLAMTPVSPDILDPEPFLEQARALASQPFQIVGYDPFRDERILWSTDRDTFASWMQVGEGGLTLREEAFVPFLDAQTASLTAADPLRYLEPTDALDKLRGAIASGQNSVNFRIRYRTSTYAVQSGDSGYRMARRLGVPFYMLQQANPGRDWDQMLTPGELINMPSVDSVIPLDPIPNKRIVVNLDTQTLWAYENGELVFNWLISSGMDAYPTSPGIYQILSHDPLATGSSIELCGSNSCGSWDMNWFMGIYEVSPGLVNGFHGAVLLPNQTYMGNGTVGVEFTYGCVMSQDDKARLLYDWANEGTVVEILSNEFEPRSEIARRALALGQATAEGYIAPQIVALQESERPVG